MELWQVNEKYHVSQMDSFDDIDERELIESDIWNADIIRAIRYYSSEFTYEMFKAEIM